MSRNAAQAADRRVLRFASLDEIVADAEVLARHGYEPLGNWSLGQVCDHLARGMHSSIDGFGFAAPLWVRLGGRAMRWWLLWRGFPAGMSLEGEAAAALMPADDVSDEQGLEALHRAVNRLKVDRSRQPSPVLGPMSPRQWDRFHFRHAELHLGFLVPRPAGAST